MSKMTKYDFLKIVSHFFHFFTFPAIVVRFARIKNDCNNQIFFLISAKDLNEQRWITNFEVWGT